MSLAPDHKVWQRQRYPHHGGALRSYMKPPIAQYGRSSPLYCHECALVGAKYGGAVTVVAAPPTCYYEESCWSLDFFDEIDFSEKIKGTQIVL